ncbi:unnamed protein product [Paramecium pentaurelia]|uniref:Myb-like domain-containing protein n=1 Tax=Paramecium pentaurelia TaxID=43138 RepID=A0A8S1XMZ8_9CILI|nr:unnamed protein product [Paramecium pentaurelia]
MIKHSISQSKKRISWSKQEDTLLQQFVNMYANQKQGCNQGYERNPKDCRERYQNYLDSKFNKTKLTKPEIDKLFELIQIYGNKWTCIAEKLNYRTDQDVKNQFYAIVKKVFRRLLKATLPEDQKKKCSKITASLRPMLISNIFCNHQNISQQYINISMNMKELFKNLIIENRSIKLGDQVDETIKKKVQQISDYLGKKNQIYLQNKSLKKTFNKRNIKKSTIKSQFMSSKNEIQQQEIILRILNNQQIFMLNQQNFPLQFDMNQDKIFKINEDQEQIVAPQYLISRPPFYKLQPSYSNQFDIQESFNEPFQDTNNINTYLNC